MLFAGWEVRMVKNCDRGLESIFKAESYKVIKLNKVINSYANYLVKILSARHVRSFKITFQFHY